MARRARVHSRDVQPVVFSPKAAFAVARVQRLDFPMNLPTTAIDELGRKLHVGTTTEIPTATVTMEAFDVSHNTFAYLTGYTPGTYPVSGASITELKSADVLGNIRDAGTQYIVNALYLKRASVTGLDASFGVRANSTITYTFSSNSKKEFNKPVYYDNFSLVTATGVQLLSHIPVYLTRSSGYTIDAYRTGSDGTTSFLNEGADYTVTGQVVNFNGASTAAGDTIWVSYAAAVTNQQFAGLDDVAPAAIQGKYVPTKISVSTIPRVQAVTIRAAFPTEQIEEMGSFGQVVGYEVGIPDVTGDITVLKTDNDLVDLLTAQANTTVEADMNFAVTNLPLKVQLYDPRDISKVLVTYYIPSITITSESDTEQVNQSMNEVFGYRSTTGELFIASGVGPW